MADGSGQGLVGRTQRGVSGQLHSSPRSVSEGIVLIATQSGASFRRPPSTCVCAEAGLRGDTEAPLWRRLQWWDLVIDRYTRELAGK